MHNDQRPTVPILAAAPQQKYSINPIQITSNTAVLAVEPFLTNPKEDIARIVFQRKQIGSVPTLGVPEVSHLDCIFYVSNVGLRMETQMLFIEKNPETRG